MVISVIGLGFVGLTTALGFAEFGHKVYGVEQDAARLAEIRTGKLPFAEPGLDDALTRHLHKSFLPVDTTEAQLVWPECDAIYFCVGTPYGEKGAADLSYLRQAVKTVMECLRGQAGFRVLAVKSTVPPGTTQREIMPYAESLGGKTGENIGIANNPEFLREGHCWDDFIHADRIVLGVSDDKTKSVLRQVYAATKIPVYCVSLNTGEFIKYLSNTLLATLISYANEMADAAEHIGDIEIRRAFEILHLDKRWNGGAMASYVFPGCGYGGYCLPKDTNAFLACANLAGSKASILRQVIAVNESMPRRSAEKIIAALGSDKRKKIGILGLSFKPGSDDCRYSPSALIIGELWRRGYRHIAAYDPQATDKFRALYDFSLEYCDDYTDIIDRADVLAILTAWDDFRDIGERTAKPVIDCRYMLPGKGCA